jgi:hypothetical protein
MNSELTVPQTLAVTVPQKWALSLQLRAWQMARLLRWALRLRRPARRLFYQRLQNDASVSPENTVTALVTGAVQNRTQCRVFDIDCWQDSVVTHLMLTQQRD